MDHRHSNRYSANNRRSTYRPSVSSAISTNISVEHRSTYRPTYRSICRSTYRPITHLDRHSDRHLDRHIGGASIDMSTTYRSRDAQTTHDPSFFCSLFSFCCCCCCFKRKQTIFLVKGLFSNSWNARSRVQTLFKSWLFQASIRNCLNCVLNCDDHTLLEIFLMRWLALVSSYIRRHAGKKQFVNFANVNLLILEVMILSMNILPSILRMRCSK